jgi:hypothetical protein
MKKIYILACLLITAFSGWGQQLFYDGFNYTPSATLGLNTVSGGVWTLIPGSTSTDSMKVSSGNLTYPGLPASVGNKVTFDAGGLDYYKEFSTAGITSGSVYSSFIVNFSGTSSAAGGYFAGYLANNSTSTFRGTLWVRNSTTAGKFQLGICVSTTPANISWLSTDYDPNVNYFIVLAYDVIGSVASDDKVRLWVNPTPGSTEPTQTIITTLTGSDLTNVSRFFLRQDNSPNTPFVEIDEVRIGTTWASVTPSGVIADPTTTSISPTSATAGGSAFTLTVNGTNFVSGSSTVTWNGSNRTTTFVSATQLTADITAADIATAGTATVGVTTTGATNASNTQTFTINSAATPTLSSTALTAFGATCINTTTGPNSFTITGTSLTATDITVGALAGYTYSTTAGGTYTSTLTLTQPGGSFSQQVFVKFTPTAVQSYDGNISITGGGATSITVAASGSGVNTAATVTTGAATNVTYSSATLPGNITTTGCGTLTSYGIEYSTTTGFVNGTGTQVTGSNLSGSSFTVDLSGLTQTTTYYYKAYVTTSVGTSYSSQSSFTTTAIPVPPAPVATAATSVTTTGFTANWNAVSGATNYYLDVYTKSPGLVNSVVAGWNFDVNSTANQVSDTGNINNINIQTLTTVGGTSAITSIGGPSALTGVNPYSATASGWDNGANTKFWQVDVNTTGASNITVSSTQGSSSTGPKEFKLQYKVGTGGSWTDVTGGTVTILAAAGSNNSSNWIALSNLALPSDADNQPLVSLRWIVTSTTSVGNGTVSSGGTSRISAVYVKGMVAGTVNNYVTGYNNLSVGNVTSYAVTGLAQNTNYFYVVRSEALGVSSLNSNEISVTTPGTPSLTAGTITGFGSQCINTTAGPNSFTLSGSNLTSADVTVGPLSGYSFSTTSGGTYTSSLTIAPVSGTVNETIYVKFTPTAVQSYNGNIAVGGGGASSINVAVTGSGINTPATVTTGAASSVTTTTATAAGSITSNGCSNVTAYGIEYSTTNGFANGAGTQAASSNLSGGNFTSALSGLVASTTFYYKTYATTSAGTSYGAQQSFTTLTPATPSLTAGTLTAFGNQCINTTAGPNSFTLSGTDLTATNVTVGPLTGYTFSTTSGGSYTSTLTLTPASGSINETIYVKFTPTAVQSYNGNISITGGGAATINVPASGSGIYTPPTATTGAASSITSTSATLAGAIPANGCSAITAYGIEYSTSNGFANGSGTQVASSNLVLPNFTSSVSGLAPSTVYYYHAYATTAAGTSYGSQQSFTTLSPALTAGTLFDFGSVLAGTSSASQSFNISGTNLAGAPGVITITAPSADFQVSNNNSTWGASTTIAFSSSTLASTPVYVRFTPQTAGAKTGNVTVAGGGATTINVALSGTATAPAVPPAPVATAATSVGSSGFTANWNAVSGATGYRLDVYTLSAGSGGSVIGGWNFDVNSTANQLSDTGNANNINIQTLTTGGGTSTIGAVGGPSSLTGLNPYAATATGWDNGANTKYWQVDVNTLGATNLTVSSIQGSSGSGPKDFKIQYKVGASGTWSDVVGGTVTMSVAASSGNSATWVALNDVPLPAAADNQSLVSLRWIMTSNTPNVTGTAVANTGTSRISGIYIKTTAGGTPGTPVYVTGYQNLAVGNVTNYAVTGLASGTNYYYVVRAENAGGSSANSNEIPVTTLAGPTLSAGSLSGFGNVCSNSTAGPNSFTITGTNLTNANVTVGPLAGYTFSTISGGTYTNSLSLTQAGGSFSQTVYVKFSPTAVQSYNGNIPVTGGGTAATVNVAATGAGINTAPTVATTAATGVTNISAVAGGTISSTGCSTVTGYGIEYSTVTGFANGTGTTVASSNLSSGSFSSNLTGLASATTYYYKAYATNGGGTSYGTELSFTTLAAPPVVLSATPLATFGSNCLNTTAGPNSFTITGSNLTNAPVTVAALAGFTYSTTANGTYSSSLSLTQPGGNLSQVVYVKFTPVANQSYNGNIVVAGGGATNVNVAATGAGSSVAPTVTTGTASSVTTYSAILSGSITNAGCPSVTSYGFEYSNIPGFLPGTGTKVVAGTNTSGSFSKNLTGLVQGNTYYFHAFATNAGGTSYGAEQSFVVTAIGAGFNVYPVPAISGTSVRITMNNLQQGYYAIVIYNSLGQKVLEKGYNIQSDFINESLNIPGSILPGIYRVQIVSNTDVLKTKTILIQ